MVRPVSTSAWRTAPSGTFSSVCRGPGLRLPLVFGVGSLSPPTFPLVGRSFDAGGGGGVCPLVWGGSFLPEPVGSLHCSRSWGLRPAPVAGLPPPSPHRRHGASITPDVSAAGRDRQVFAQHDGKGFEHQSVAGRPEIDFLAVLERDPVEQPEAIAP